MVYNYQQQFKYSVENLNKSNQLKIETWYKFTNLTKKEYGNYVKKIHKKLKQEIYNNCPSCWNKKYTIVDLKMRDEIGIQENQNSFFCCDIFLRQTSAPTSEDIKNCFRCCKF
jgi:RecG-like helicase